MFPKGLTGKFRDFLLPFPKGKLADPLPPSEDRTLHVEVAFCEFCLVGSLLCLIAAVLLSLTGRQGFRSFIVH